MQHSFHVFLHRWLNLPKIVSAARQMTTDGSASNRGGKWPNAPPFTSSSHSLTIPLLCPCYPPLLAALHNASVLKMVTACKEARGVFFLWVSECACMLSATADAASSLSFPLFPLLSPSLSCCGEDVLTQETVTERIHPVYLVSVFCSWNRIMVELSQCLCIALMLWGCKNGGCK